MSKYIEIDQNQKLVDIADRIGDRNVSSILSANGLSRAVNIGQKFIELCNNTISSSEDVSWKTKVSTLNTMTTDSDVFEKASLQSDNDWKVLVGLGTFPRYLRIPDGIYVPDSINILGNGVPVAKHIYEQTLADIESSETHAVDPNIYNEYSSIKSAVPGTNLAGGSYPLGLQSNPTGGVFQDFKLPWHEIVLYDSISQDSIEFPVYPEEYQDKRNASYDQMPDILYQYEPWFVYQSSGPRQNTFTFHMHRQMWSGNESDGQANRLIRFCEACVYPNYSGSAVITPTVQLRVHGNVLISGILTDVSVNWSGPISRIDGWYLDFTLELSITEVSEVALNHDTVKSFSLIG